MMYEHNIFFKQTRQQRGTDHKTCFTTPVRNSDHNQTQSLEFGFYIFQPN